MSNLLSHDWFVIPGVALCIFVIFYMWSDRLINALQNKSLGQRAEVMRLMELMFIEVDQKRVTITMLLLSFGLGFLFFILFWPNLIAGFIFGSVITVVGWSIPLWVMRNLYERRCNRFVDQMIDAMTMLANGVKANLSVIQCMERVSQNMPNPISQEFSLVLSQMRLGRSMNDSLNELGTRVPRPDVQMFVTSVNILNETGGNMAETFQTIVHVVRERQKVEKKIEALTAQGLMQGVIITLVPFILLLVFAVVDPNYIKPMFSTTLGLIALLVMLSLQVIGGLAIRKIVKINV
jgi:tight adherence protein B